KRALADRDPRIRTEGRRILATLQPDAILGDLKTALDTGTPIDRQGAFALLGDLTLPGTATLLETWLDKLLAKQVPAEVQLDLLEAAAKHSTGALRTKLAHYEAARSSSDPLAKWAETLYGGDA